MTDKDKPRTILVGSRIDFEEAAKQLRECSSYADLAKRWGRSVDRVKHIAMELRDLGFDCGETKYGPKPKARV